MSISLLLGILNTVSFDLAKKNFKRLFNRIPKLPKFETLEIQAHSMLQNIKVKKLCSSTMKSQIREQMSGPEIS